MIKIFNNFRENIYPFYRNRIIPFLKKIGSKLFPNDRFIEVVATVAIALATIKGCQLQEKMADISNKLADIERNNSSYNKTALQVEYRPYLIINLEVGGDLKRYGNGVLYFDYTNQTYFIVSFTLINAGKVPAVKVDPKYTSYWQNANMSDIEIQPDVPIEQVEDVGHIFSIGESNLINRYGPHINISPVKDNPSARGLKVIIKVKYQGNPEIDARTYFSKLILIFRKEEENGAQRFILIKGKEEYGWEN